jgi:hypothetical protein
LNFFSKNLTNLIELQFCQKFPKLQFKKCFNFAQSSELESLVKNFNCLFIFSETANKNGIWQQVPLLWFQEFGENF